MRFVRLFALFPVGSEVRHPCCAPPVRGMDDELVCG